MPRTDAPTGSTPALLLKPDQAAESLAISPRKLWEMTSSGQIPHIRLGRCVRYSIDDLQKRISAQKQGGANGEL